MLKFHGFVRIRLAAVVAAVVASITLIVLPTTPASASTPADCKLSDPGSVNLSEGFGSTGPFLPSTGTVNAKMIFVDFPDAPATETVTQARDRFMPSAPNWYNTGSYGNMTLSITAETGTGWMRMPQNSTYYQIERGLTAAIHGAYIQAALEKADDYFLDFSTTQILYVVPTMAATEIELSPTYMQAISAWSWEGYWYWNGSQWQWLYHWVSRSIGKTVTFGVDVQNTWGSDGTKVLNHETGHAMGLPDLYTFGTGETHQFVGGWDIMGKISGKSPDMLAWHKWKLGWLPDSQVTCVTGDEYTEQWLTPIETSTGQKAIVVKTGTDTAIVVEVRKNTNNDSNGCNNGVLIYSVDRRIASGSGPIRLIDANPSTSYTCGGDSHALYNATFTTGASGNDFYQSWSTTTIDVYNSDINGYYFVKVWA
jgi:M6 family metalloprotease-like protein